MFGFILKKVGDILLPRAGKLLHKSTHALGDGTDLRHDFLHHLDLDGDRSRRDYLPLHRLQRQAR